jgi:hypothetical protein
MSEFFPIKRHRFLVRTKHRSASPSEKPSFNGLVECGPLETKCVVDEAQAEDAARRIDVQLAVGMMEFRDTDERRAEQTVPGADIGLARTDQTEVNRSWHIPPRPRNDPRSARRTVQALRPLGGLGESMQAMTVDGLDTNRPIRTARALWSGV